MKQLAPVLLVVVLAGCSGPLLTVSATVPPPSDADITDAALPLNCKSKEQCDRWWRAAQVWVARNSGWKIQVATDAVVETYNPATADGWAVRLTRMPDPDGLGDTVEIRPTCRLPGRCAPAMETLVADFKRALLAIR